MKIALIFTFACQILFCFGQGSFSGTYVTSQEDIGFESEVFQFQEDGTFSYILFTCTGTWFGKGFYEVSSRDSLKLNFKDCLNCEKRIQIETEQTQTDSLHISLTVCVDDGVSCDTIPGVAVFLPSEKIGTITMKNGHASFKTDVQDKDRTLGIQFTGYITMEINIPAHTSKLTGNVILKNSGIYDSSDIQSNKILEWTSSILRLQQDYGYSIAYVKMQEKDVDKLLIDALDDREYQVYINKIKTP